MTKQNLNFGGSMVPLGQGGRFAALKNKLAGEKRVKNPGALAASIGRKKYGKAKMQSMASKGLSEAMASASQRS